METAAKTVRHGSPSIYLSRETYNVLSLMCANHKDEWTMFGKTREIAPGKFEVYDFYIPEQKNGGASTEVEEDAMEKMLVDLMERGEDPKDYNVWIHSHHSMGCFWSGTDYDQMDSFGELGIDFMFSIVVSTSGARSPRECATLAALNLYKPVRVNVPTKVMILAEENQAVMEAVAGLEEQLKEKETKYVYTPPAKRTHIPHAGHVSQYGELDDEEDVDYERDFLEQIAHKILEDGTYIDTDKNQEVIDRLYLIDPSLEDIFTKSDLFIGQVAKVYSFSKQIVRRDFKKFNPAK